MNLQQLTKKTIKVADQFPNKWTASTRYIDLVDEVGELGSAMLSEWGEKKKASEDHNVQKEMCDVLYDLLLLAHDFDIDLQSSYLKNLKSIETRCQKGEFIVK